MIEQGETIPTPLADMYIELVLKCQAYYTLNFSAGFFNYSDELRCYERGGHTDAHKTRLSDFSETGAIIYWNNFKTLKCGLWCEGGLDCKQGLSCKCRCHQ